MKSRAWLTVAVLACGGLAAVAGQPERTLVYGGDSNFPPYEYLDERGRPAGFNVALMQFAALKANLPIDIQLTPWTEVLPRLERGETDVVSLAYSEERAQRYAFLAQTWTLQQAVLFRPGRDSYPGALNELANEVVAVEGRSLVHDLITALPEVQRPVLKVVTSQPDAVRIFLANEATAVAGNELSLRFAAGAEADDRFVAIRVKSFAYHLATRRGHEEAVAPLLRALGQLSAEGTVHRLVEQHLNVSAPLSWRRIARYVLPIGLIALAGAAGVAAWTRALQHRVRHRTLELLRQRNDLEQQARLLNLAHDAIIVREPDGAVRFWNRGAEELYGWPAREVMGRDLKELLQTEFPAPLDRIEEELGRSGRWEGELQQRARDGRRVRVKSRWALQRGPDGHREAVLAINTDITDERAAHERMAAAEERLRGVVDHLLGGLIVVDEGSRIEMVNPAAERITGWSRDELVGQPLAVLLPPGVDDLEKFYMSAREQGMGRRTHWTLKRKDGALVRFELSLFEFHAGGRRYIGGSMREAGPPAGAGQPG